MAKIIPSKPKAPYVDHFNKHDIAQKVATAERQFREANGMEPTVEVDSYIGADRLTDEL
jgi:hypothetical protein